MDTADQAWRRYSRHALSNLSHLPKHYKTKTPQNIAAEGKLDTCIALIFPLLLLWTQGEITFACAGIIHVPENTMHCLSGVSCRPGDLCLGAQLVDCSYPSCAAEFVPCFCLCHLGSGQEAKAHWKNTALKLNMYFEEPKRTEIFSTRNQF